MKNLQKLTLEARIGQMFVVGFEGTSPDAETQDRIHRIQPGGFVLFQRNIESFEQIYALNQQLHATCRWAPLLAVDAEGGRVDRLKHIFGPVPAMPELALDGVPAVRAGARAIASALETTGFNTNLAPVADLRLPGSTVVERAVSASPERVTSMCGIFVAEMERRGILSCLKHFPGLGGAVKDPHFKLPVISRSRKQLLQEDIEPFRALMDKSPLMMVGHAFYPAFGDETPVPASLSARVIEKTLRKKLGYTGLVLTDDLTMGAVASRGITPELFLEAILAGNDLLMFSQATPSLESAIRWLAAEARRSEALRERVEQSVNRILRLKARLPVPQTRHRAQMRSRIARQIGRLPRVAVSIETTAAAR